VVAAPLGSSPTETGGCRHLTALNSTEFPAPPSRARCWISRPSCPRGSWGRRWGRRKPWGSSTTVSYGFK